MDPSIPTSFIPKRPITNEPMTVHTNSRTVGLLSLITVIVIVGTAVAFGGVYVYQKSLVSQKAQLEQSIDDARGGIGTDFLTEMKRLNARISGVKSLIQSHIVVSPIFAAIEATTLHSVQYKTFTYEFTVDPGTKAQMVRVSIDGSAKNYSTIALQSDAFSQSTLIKNPVFSNLTVDDKANTVNFKLVFDVSPSDLSYQAFIDGKTSTAPGASAQPFDTTSVLSTTPIDASSSTLLQSPKTP